MYSVNKNSLYNLILYFQIYVLHSGAQDMWLNLTLTDSNFIQHPTSPCTFLLWQMKAHYNLHNSVPMTPILIQLNPHHALPPYFLKIHINFIITSKLMSLSRLLHSGFINKILNPLLIPPMCARMYHPENYKVTHYVTFSSLVLLALPIFQILSSASLIYVLPWMYNTSFTLISNKKQNYCFIYFNIYVDIL